MNAMPPRRSVLQDWVQSLTFMQQSVLIAAVRGPDGVKKDHPVKVLCRWLRRSFLLSAFDRCALNDPASPGGGSFTGPSVDKSQLERLCDGHALWHCDDGCPPWWFGAMDDSIAEYLRHIDELPHHFQLHFMHAAEILGYKHPVDHVRGWWHRCYLRIVNDAHLFPESEAQMDHRLGDTEAGWRAREEVTARGPQGGLK